MRPILITVVSKMRISVILPLALAAGLSGCIEVPGGSNGDTLGEAVERSQDVLAARVEHTAIYISDVERAAKAQQRIGPNDILVATDPVFTAVLDELIDQRLLALAALDKGLNNEDEFRRRLAVSRERILSSRLVEAHLEKTVNEDTLLQMYEAQSGLRAGNDEVRARHILVKTEAEIKDIVKALAAGEDFAEIAKERSLDLATRETGGELDFFTVDTFAPEFSRVAFSTPNKERSAPFQTTFGWHVLEVLGRRKVDLISFDEARGELTQFMTYSEIEKLVTSLRASGAVERFNPGANTITGETPAAFHPSKELPSDE